MTRRSHSVAGSQVALAGLARVVWWMSVWHLIQVPAHCSTAGRSAGVTAETPGPRLPLKLPSRGWAESQGCTSLHSWDHGLQSEATTHPALF